MKRKFLASILVVAMLAAMLSSVTVMADDTAGVTYFDMNMDDWSNYYANTNTDGTSNNFSWTWNNTVTLDTDVAKGNKSWKLTTPCDRFTSADRHYSYVRIDQPDTSKYFDKNYVYWTEASLKFEGQFAAVGWEYNSAVAPVVVDANGNLRQIVKQGYNGESQTIKGTDLNYQLELGKWYHIVVALDIRNETSSGAPIYIWVNGEDISAANTDVAFSTQKIVKYIQLWFDEPASGYSTVWVDNYKFYTTTDLDNHAESNFNITVADADADDSIALYEKAIAVPSDATVGAVKAGITTDNTANTIFVKNGTALADTDLAVGSVMTVNASNGIGFKQYDITDNPSEEDITPEHAETYFDMNMDDWTTFNTNKNIDGTTVASPWTWNDTVTLDADAAKGNKSWKLTMPAGERFSDKHYSYVQAGTLDSTKYFDKNYVYWTEVSLKFEGQFTAVGWEHNSAVAPLVVDHNGHLRQFVKQGYTDANSLMSGKDLNYHLELGKWYHIVVALDIRNETSSGAPIYIWVNGEDISTANTDVAFSTQKIVKYIQLWFDKPATGSSTVWVDNYKYYITTDLDTHAESNFNVTVEDANADDSITISGKSAIVPSDATVGAVKAGINTDSTSNTVFVKNGVTLADSDMAVGSVMTVNSSNGIGFKQYDVIDHLPAEDIIPGHVKSITASLPEMNSTHPVSKMIDDSIAGDNLYKTSKKYDDQPLKVQITLDGVYEIEKLSIYERFVVDYGTSVSAYLGKNGVFTQVADNVDLRAHLPSGINRGTATLTSINIADTIEDKEADTIIFIFTGERPETETNYQIYEIEAYGYKTGDVADTGFVPEYFYWSATGDVVVSLMNASNEPVEGQIFVAAYSGDMFMAITTPQPVSIEKGITQYTIPASDIKADGYTYKAFIWDDIDSLKPLPLVGAATIAQ